jgi:TM2 domain-containing membrane protein YozV
MVFCDNCGHTLRLEAKFCGKCGNQITEIETPSQDTNQSYAESPPKQNVNSGKVLQRPPEWKSMGVTMVLTVVLGIIGLGGIGHLYLGKIIKGIVLCIVGIILLAVTIFTVFMGLVILIPFALIVVYDAYRLCKRYNNHLEQTGRPPW